MRLTGVRLRHFRNLDSIDLEVPSGGAVLVGPNGHGKTNFLEAIHFASRFRSFRTARRTDAIGFGHDHFRVSAELEVGPGRRRTVAVAVDRKQRKISVDERTLGTVSEGLGSLLSVLVCPGDLSLVAGPPEDRRRYLDDLLSTTDRRYARALTEYERALRQRNELLRVWPPVAGSELASWNEAVITSGVPVVEARRSVAGRLAERFGIIGAEIAGPGGRSAYGFAYRPAIRGLGAGGESVGDAWRAALEADVDRDRRQGWTTSGPHRDDLKLTVAGRGLARFGSQGEQRTGAIALRLLEIEFVEAESGEAPILLLDDVFSELDAGRGERLLAWIGARHQKFATTPRPATRIAAGLAQWSVHEGTIVARLAAA